LKERQKERMEIAGRKGRRNKQLMDDPKEEKG